MTDRVQQKPHTLLAVILSIICQMAGAHPRQNTTALSLFASASLLGELTYHEVLLPQYSDHNQPDELALDMSSTSIDEVLVSKFFCGTIIFSSAHLQQVLAEQEIAHSRELTCAFLLVPVVIFRNNHFNYRQANTVVLLVIASTKASLKMAEKIITSSGVSNYQGASVLLASGAAIWLSHGMAFGRPTQLGWIGLPKIMGSTAISLAYKTSAADLENLNDLIMNGFRWYGVGVLLEQVATAALTPDKSSLTFQLPAALEPCTDTLYSGTLFTLSMAGKLEKQLGYSAADTLEYLVRLNWADDDNQQILLLLVLSQATNLAEFAQLNTPFPHLAGSFRRGLIVQQVLCLLRIAIPEMARLLDSTRTYLDWFFLMLPL